MKKYLILIILSLLGICSFAQGTGAVPTQLWWWSPGSSTLRTDKKTWVNNYLKVTQARIVPTPTYVLVMDTNNVLGKYALSSIEGAFDTTGLSLAPKPWVNDYFARKDSMLWKHTTNSLLTLKNSNDAILAVGTYGSGWIEPSMGTGYRMLWYPRKGSFRVGYASGDSWDDSNIGSKSFASGIGTKATQTGSTAMGNSTIASGLSSVALGDGAEASGQFSVALGDSPIASAYGSVALGTNTGAFGVASFAAGNNNVASGRNATSLGSKIVVSGYNSFGIGLNDTTLWDLTRNNTAAIMGGNVGINTLNPTEEFQVTGDVKISDTLFPNSKIKFYGNSGNIKSSFSGNPLYKVSELSLIPNTGDIQLIGKYTDITDTSNTKFVISAFNGSGSAYMQFIKNETIENTINFDAKRIFSEIPLNIGSSTSPNDTIYATGGNSTQWNTVTKKADTTWVNDYFARKDSLLWTRIGGIISPKVISDSIGYRSLTNNNIRFVSMKDTSRYSIIKLNASTSTPSIQITSKNSFGGNANLNLAGLAGNPYVAINFKSNYKNHTEYVFDTLGMYCSLGRKILGRSTLPWDTVYANHINTPTGNSTQWNTAYSARPTGGSSGDVWKNWGGVWGAHPDSTGGAGGITSISQGTGMLNSANPITSTGTIGVDTSKVVMFSDTSGGNSKIQTKYQSRNYLTSIPNSYPLRADSNLNKPNGYVTPKYLAGNYAQLNAQNEFLQTQFVTGQGSSEDWYNGWRMADKEGWYGFTDNTQSLISFNPTDSTFTLAKSGVTNIEYIRDAVICSITATRTIKLTGAAGAAGTYYIYIDDNSGTLSISTVAWTLKDTKVPVAIIKWNKNAPAGIKYKMEDERHGGGNANGGLWPRGLHYYAHANIGPRFQAGGIATGTVGGTITAQNFIRINEAEIDDEDMSIIIPAKAAPTAGVANNYFHYYRTNTTTWTWDTCAMPYMYNGATGGVSTYIQYDNAATGVLTAAVNNRWVNSYIAFTNIKGNDNAKDSARIIIIPGRAQFTSLALAQAEDLATFDWTGFGIAECVIRYRVTWNTSGVASSVLGRVTLAAQPVAIQQGISTSAIPVAVAGWAVIGNDVIQNTTGSVGIGDAVTPRYTASIVHAAAGINLTDPNYNLNRTDSIKAADSASALTQIVGGNPKTDYRNKRGFTTFAVDTSGTVTMAPKIWKSVTGAYASGTTFTYTASTTKDYILCVSSLFQCRKSDGTVLRVGYIKSATQTGMTVTATVVSNSAIASGDIDFLIAYNEKVDGISNNYRWTNTVPGVVVSDNANYQGMYYLNTPDTMYFVSSIPAVMTAASGAGAAATYNIYDATTALYATAPDMGTSAVLADQIPATAYKIAPGRNVTLRWLTSAGATTKCSDAQVKVTWIPSSILRAK